MKHFSCNLQSLHTPYITVKMGSLFIGNSLSKAIISGICFYNFILSQISGFKFRMSVMCWHSKSGIWNLASETWM